MYNRRKALRESVATDGKTVWPATLREGVETATSVKIDNSEGAYDRRKRDLGATAAEEGAGPAQHRKADGKGSFHFCGRTSITAKLADDGARNL